METVLMLVLLAGGSLWAYRQWQAVRRRPDGPAIVVREATAEPWQVIDPPANPPARLNKYLVLLLCVLYILWPIDLVPDFIPVAGWGDDVAALLIGLRALFKS